VPDITIETLALDLGLERWLLASHYAAWARHDRIDDIAQLTTVAQEAVSDEPFLHEHFAKLRMYRRFYGVAPYVSSRPPPPAVKLIRPPAS